jgi:RNA recognition motif-containing protein
MGARLFVGNLNFELSDDALRDTFAEFGPVQRAERA